MVQLLDYSLHRTIELCLGNQSCKYTFAVCYHHQRSLKYCSCPILSDGLFAATWSRLYADGFMRPIG